MTKVELIEKMAKDAKVTKAAAGRALDSFIEGVNMLDIENKQNYPKRYFVPVSAKIWKL